MDSGKDSTGGAYSAPPAPQLDLTGPLRGREGMGNGSGGKMEREETRRGGGSRQKWKGWRREGVTITVHNKDASKQDSSAD